MDNITDKKIRKTINKKISLLAAVSIILIVMVAQILSASQLKTVMTDQSFELLQTETKNNADIISNWLQNQADSLTVMLNSLSYMNTLSAESIMDYLEIQLEQNPDALMYYVCFEYNKSVLPADHSHIELDPTGRDWWKQAVAKRGIIYTDPYVDYTTGQMIVSIAAPLTIQNERAVILADITIDKLIEIVKNICTDEDMTAFLLAQDGSVITHPNETYLPNQNGNTVLTDQVTLDIDSRAVTSFTDYDGALRYVSVSEVSAAGWKIGVTREQKTLSDRIQKYVSLNLLKISVLALAAIGLLYFVLTKMLNPVNDIVNAIVHISEGDFSLRLKQSGQKDEIGILQNTVWELTETLSAIIGDANRVLGSMAAYHLSVEDMQNYPGDFNRLAVSVNSVKNILCGLLSEVKEVSGSVQNGSSQLADAADSLSRGSVTQSEAIQSLTSEILDMAERIKKSSTNCNEVGEMLTELDAEIKNGNAEMASLLVTVSQIEEMSEDIQKVMGAIDAIASQTNILALNASVEAARAGEHGRGFAVVAQEVRKLAVNCAEESRKTSELLEGCLRAINDTKKHADTTSGRLGNVEKNSAGIADNFKEFSEEMEAQAENSREIQNGLTHIADVVHSNTAAAQQTAAASTELSNQAVTLKQMTHKFILE